VQARQPAADRVICELVNDDGTVTRGEQVDAFAVKHGLKQVSVADLIAYRQRKETLIEHIDSFDVETAGQGESLFLQAALGSDASSGRGLRRHPRRRRRAGRLHLESVVDDVFSKHDPMTAIINRMASEGRGVVVYLREGSVGVGQQASGGRLRRSARTMPKRRRARTNGWKSVLGAQILKDLGISSIKLYASRERHYVGLEGFGIQIVEIIDRPPRRII
jgi:3,4-dihydroxy 2-butanone 4-phosphate synthase/GTP cyclohydrolase II